MNIASDKFYDLYRESQNKLSIQMEKISYKKIPMGVPIPDGFQKVGLSTKDKIYLFQ